MNLRFDPEEHSYWLGETRIPGVSEILQDLGVIDTRFYKPEHAQRGRAIHAAIAEWEREKQVNADYPEYVAAWINFCEAESFEPKTIEIPIYHQVFMYGGTPDSIGMVRDGTIVVDIKTGQPERWHELQLVAYGDMVGVDLKGSPGLMCVYLKKDGSYKVKTHSYKEKDAWIGMLRAYRWKHAR